MKIDDYFMKMVDLVADRSTCKRRKVGAILVKDGMLLSTGYNGAASGLEHCTNKGCLREKMKIPSGERVELCIGVHAEQNAIIQCARKNTNLEGATLYCTTSPCVTCAKMLINAKIKNIIYKEEYNDNLAFELLKKSKVECRKYHV